ncbi:hypothetical protein MHU86_23462 [Fragilaria crotonensis]|nr:hypothetical protein MHU86_23462 [Fragilaria crotonensis]
MMTTTLSSSETAPRRQLVDYTRQGKNMQQLGSCVRCLDESITRFQQCCNSGNSEDKNTIIAKTTPDDPRRLLIDYTKQGRSMQHLRNCDRSLLEMKPEGRPARSKSMSFDDIPSVLRVSFSSIDSCGSLIDDGEVNTLTRRQADDDDTVEFFLKIPSRASRVRQSSVNELRDLFKRQPKSNKKGHGFIQRLLSEPPVRSRCTTPVVSSK